MSSIAILTWERWINPESCTLKRGIILEENSAVGTHYIGGGIGRKYVLAKQTDRIVIVLMTKSVLYETFDDHGTFFIIRPSSDGTYYGMVMSVRPSGSPSVRPILRPSGSPSARFPHFSPTCFDILSWNFAHGFLFLYYRSSSSVVALRQFLRSYASLWTQNIGIMQFSALFSYMLWHIELKFCIWLCFYVLQIKFECRHFASIFEGVIPLFELRI